MHCIGGHGALRRVRGPSIAAQAPVDSALARYINSHPRDRQPRAPHAPVRPARQPTRISTRCRSTESHPSTCRARLKPDDPIWRAAQNALYRIAPTMSGPPTTPRSRTRSRTRSGARGQKFPEWALDQAGIDMMMANRIAMGPGLAAAALSLGRVRRSAAPAARHDAAKPRERRTRARCIRAKPSSSSAISRDLNVKALPATLDDYVRTVVESDAAREARERRGRHQVRGRVSAPARLR